MENIPPFLNEAQIAGRIFFVRGQKVMLDSDLAMIYGVTTKRLNQQMKRNIERFPPDFMFQLLDAEYSEIFSESLPLEESDSLRLQNATLKSQRGRHRKYLPFVFTEHGAVMLASVLNSRQAIEASILVVRAFIKLRELMTEFKELADRINELENKYDGQFQLIFDAIKQLMKKDVVPRRQIGFKKNGPDLP